MRLEQQQFKQQQEKAKEQFEKAGREGKLRTIGPSTPPVQISEDKFRKIGGGEPQRFEKSEQEKEIESSIEFGSKEKELGVGVNRETAHLQKDTENNTVIYRDQNTRVEINIERDRYFVELLEGIKERIDKLELKDPANKARMIVRAAIAATPKVDESGELHKQGERYMLGRALRDGVICVDRALLMEAALKMMGVTQDAKMLMCVKQGAWQEKKENHTDIQFSVNGKKYIAVTMGERAGEVLGEKQYMIEYLKWREKKGLGRRRIEKNWGYPHFEAVK